MSTTHTTHGRQWGGGASSSIGERPHPWRGGRSGAQQSSTDGSECALLRIHFLCPINLQGRYCDAAHFTDDKTDDQRAKVNRPGPIAGVGRSWDRNPGRPGKLPPKAPPPVSPNLIWEEEGGGRRSLRLPHGAWERSARRITELWTQQGRSNHAGRAKHTAAAKQIRASALSGRVPGEADSVTKCSGRLVRTFSSF